MHTNVSGANSKRPILYHPHPHIFQIHSLNNQNLAKLDIIVNIYAHQNCTKNNQNALYSTIVLNYLRDKLDHQKIV